MRSDSLSWNKIPIVLHCKTCPKFYLSFSRCLCRGGWTGKTCDTEIDECAVSTANPCLNGATCVDQVNNVSCECAPFYTGRFCETPYDPCGQGYSPCENNATCLVHSNGSYSCLCQTGKHDDWFKCCISK